MLATPSSPLSPPPNALTAPPPVGLIPIAPSGYKCAGQLGGADTNTAHEPVTTNAASPNGRHDQDLRLEY